MDIEVKQKWRDKSDAELKEEFKGYLETSNRFCRRALLALFDKQTEEERRYPYKVHQSNGLGFSEQDQAFLSSLANQCLRGADLTPRQYNILHEMLPKYAGQLVKITRYNQRREDEIKRGEVMYFKTSQFKINNTGKSFDSYEDTLGVDLDGLPPTIVIESPSGGQSYRLMLEGIDTRPAVAYALYHTGLNPEVDWEARIYEFGDPDNDIDFERELTINDPEDS